MRSQPHLLSNPKSRHYKQVKYPNRLTVASQVCSRVKGEEPDTLRWSKFTKILGSISSCDLCSSM